jgi:hypothetical protein
MTQAQTKPLTFVEFLEQETGDVQYDLLADGSLNAQCANAGNAQALCYPAGLGIV